MREERIAEVASGITHCTPVGRQYFSVKAAMFQGLVLEIQLFVDGLVELLHDGRGRIAPLPSTTDSNSRAR